MPAFWLGQRCLFFDTGRGWRASAFSPSISFLRATLFHYGRSHFFFFLLFFLSDIHFIFSLVPVNIQISPALIDWAFALLGSFSPVVHIFPPLPVLFRPFPQVGVVERRRHVLLRQAAGPMCSNWPAVLLGVRP